eukprot:TRINITY_DN953_c0_g1_i4.p1 TRINITY_DN953_c0_g1~~TRINITY_DN953_c0_g1_i4.p1  ORF type:complete len:422 (+),score=93.19 TRINITY_DN953_c0_g1_i4:51-1268(+)
MEWDLVAAAVQAVMEVLVVASFGAFLAGKGVFPIEAVKVVDKLILHLFIPCLVLDSVVPQVRPSMFQDLWPLMIVCFWNLFWGILIGWIVAAILRAPHLKGIVQACIAFPNTTAVVLTLAQALSETTPLLKLYKRVTPEKDLIGKTDSEMQADAFDKATALVLTSTVWWSIAKWAVAYNLMAPSDSGQSWKQRAKKLVNPPIIACLLAFSIGFIPGIGDWWQGHSRTALVIVGSLEKGGRCLVPGMLMVLGARIYHSLKNGLFSKKDDPEQEPLQLQEGNPNDEPEPEEPLVEAGYEDAHSNVEDDQELSTVAKFMIIFFRQVVCLALGLFLVWAVSHASNDVIMLLICFLQTAGPPMINLSVMAGIHGSYEVGLAQVLMVAYLFSILSWVVGITTLLALLDKIL